MSTRGRRASRVTTDEPGGCRFLLELEVDGVAVDPREPQYWWPDPDQPPGPPVDVSHWRELGATTDEVPEAFRRRPARGEAPGARERGQLV